MRGRGYRAGMRCSFAVVASCTGLLAQDAAVPIRFAPSDCLLVARTDGPAAWRAAFAATRIGQVVAADAMAPVWRGLVDRVLAEWSPTAAQRAAGARVWQRLREHRGAIELAVRVDWEQLAERAPDEPWPVTASLAFGADGATDLAALAQDLTALLPALQPLAVDGVEGVMATAGTYRITAPIVRADRVVVLGGAGLAAIAPAFFAEEERFELDPEAARAALGYQIEGAAITHHFVDLVPRDDAERALVEAFAEEGGLDTAQRLVGTLRADGASVESMLRVDFDPGSRGALDALLPVRDRAPSLLAAVPADAAGYKVSVFDAAALFGWLLPFLERRGEDFGTTRAAFEAQFTALTKLRLQEDVIAPLGSEYLVLGGTSALGGLDPDRDADPKAAAFGEGVFAVQLRDGAALATSIDRALRARGLHVGRRTAQHGDIAVHRLLVLGAITIEYAVTDTLLVVGVGGGERPQRDLRAVLDAARAAARPAFAPAVAAHVAAMPGGYAGIEVVALTETLQEAIAGFEVLQGWLAKADLTLDDVDTPWTLLVPALPVLQKECAAQGLEVAVALEYCGAERYTVRQRW